MLPLLLALACGSGEGPTVGPDLEVRTEPGILAVEPLWIENGSRSRDLIVTDLYLEPDAEVVRWDSGGPWTLAPGDRTEVRIRFSPQAEGTWSETLVVVTDAGTVSASVELIAEVGEDGDGDGWSVTMGDCDDADPSAFPDAPEQCDGTDDDCDEEVDEDFDWDGDGHLDADACEAIGGDDCDDRDGTAWPGRDEECDKTDSDCNGLVDDIGLPADLQDGVCEGLLKRCTAGGPAEPLYSELDGYEQRERSCDGLDNDCDGGADDFDRDGAGGADCTDDDADGYAEVDGDCDDTDPAVLPEHCGTTSLLVTSTVGYGLVDLALDTASLTALGGMLYDAIQLDADTAWFTDRSSLLLEVDLATGSYTGVTLDGGPWGILLDPGATRAWLALYDGRLVGIRIPEMTLVQEWEVGAAATGLSWDEDGTIWGCGADGVVFHLDPWVGAVDTVATGLDCYGPPIVDVDHDRVLIPGYVASALGVIGRSTGLLEDTIALDDRALQGVLTDDALFLTGGIDGTLARLDRATLEVVTTFDLGAQVTDTWWDADRQHLWVAIFGADRVVRLDPDDGTEQTGHDITGPTLLIPVE